MVTWTRIASTVGWNLVVVALGGLFVAIAVGLTLVRLQADTVASSVLVVSTFIAVPGFVLLYGSYRLSDSDVHPDFHRTIAIWSLAGLGAMVGILGIYDVLAEGGLTSPSRSIPILTSFAAVAGFGVGIHDARAQTRERELEEAVERLRTSNERLEQFAYAASHDLQEPLRMVSSYLQLIERRADDELSEETREFLAFAVDGADRMREMIDGLLQYSRVETRGEPFEPVDLNAVVEDARKDLRIRIEDTDADIAVEPLPYVEGDPRQLRQVFQNLLANAVEYSGDEPPRVHVSATRNGTTWTVSVRDEGIGIDPDDQEDVFEIFQRLHSRDDHPGTGIGLALCKRIVERHGGELWVDSEPGEGSTFSFSLPTKARTIR